MQGLTGNEEQVMGMFRETRIVRDGNEQPVAILQDVLCAPGIHTITAGMLAYPMIRDLVVCPEHLSSIMTQEEYNEYQKFMSKQST